MENLSNHFESLINWIKDPVMIFIDDLDRCTGEYRVEFLEGVQTLFRKPNVIILIAADRHWICTSYEKIYSSFNTTIEEQSSPLGYRFLEKIFQLSITVPSTTEEQQKKYWEKLIKKTNTTNEKLSDRNEVNSNNKSSGKEPQGRNTADTINYVDQDAVRKRIKALNSPEAESETEKFLSDFSHLLERNPRAMKKLVNAYGIMRDKGIIKDLKITERTNQSLHESLVRWTILNSRWPILAEYLGAHPIMLKYAYGNCNDLSHSGIPNNLQSLFQNESVQNVIGKDVKNSY